ncbi:hypothetical protein H2199_008940 [Coniosporium tulheliwenetii]|uniref:Uncharacterized protein n=1 Tax=Coniosporium tulheliwenetii TaxID=3383036 RepID=A0ACC2YH48_9PEZI|nr:hypothetical protein H2199_008940 [Cladosporium sp. JES 115]
MAPRLTLNGPQRASTVPSSMPPPSTKRKRTSKASSSIPARRRKRRTVDQPIEASQSSQTVEPVPSQALPEESLPPSTQPISLPPSSPLGPPQSIKPQLSGGLEWVNDLMELDTKEGEEQLDERFKYDSSWVVLNGKETLDSQVSIREVNWPVYSIRFSELEAFERAALKASSPRRFVRHSIEATLSHDRLAVTNQLKQTIKVQRDIKRLAEVLREWHKNSPQRSLRLNIIIAVKEVVDLNTIANTARSQLLGTP